MGDKADKRLGKANKLLGLERAASSQPIRPSGERSKTLNQGPGFGKVSVQRAGYLSKRPFYSKGVLGGQWSKRYFVLKDSFLLWYKKKPPAEANYSIYPEGVLPLGGCSVHQEGKDGSGFLFEVTHPEFNGRSLMLRSDKVEDAQEWIAVLSECKDATWDNAMFGDAQAHFLEARGTVEEKERQRVLEEMQEKAALALEAAAEKQKLMEDQLRKRREYQELLEQKAQERQTMLEKIQQKNEDLQKQKEALEAEEEERLALEIKLEDAKNAVAELEKIVKQQRGAKVEALLADIAELKRFLEGSTKF